MEATQARNRCQVIKRKIAFQVSLYAVQYAGEPASVQSFRPDRQYSPSTRRSDTVLNQSCCETGGQGLRQQPAGESLALKFRDNCICDLSQKRVPEAPFSAETLDERFH